MNSSTNTILYHIKNKSWLLLLPLMLGVFLSSCGDSPVDAQTETALTDSSEVNTSIDMVPEQFDAVGTIQGTIIDKASGEALSDVAVSLNFSPEGGEPSVISDTADGDGTFSFTGVPVNTDAKTYLNAGDANSPYTLRITAENHENYRDLYRYNANLSFESTGGDGAATNLVSDVTVPLAEQAVTLMGKAHTSSDAVLADVKVKLYHLNFNPIINGNSMTQTDMLVDSTTTGSDGGFEFTGVEEKSNVMLKFIDDSDPSEVINYSTNVNDLPSADGSATPKRDVGVIQVTSSNQSGALYLASVTPEPGSDVGTDTMFTYVFNRPIAENEYTRTDLGFGNGTIIDDIHFTDNGMKKAPGDVEFSVSYGKTRDTLIINPEESTMEDASEYELDVRNAFGNDKFVDEYGNDLTYGASDYSSGDVETLDFSTNDNNSKPHTPSISVDSETNDVDWGGSFFEDMTVTWDVSDDPAEVKAYEVYASKNGGAYRYFMTIDRDNASYGKIEQEFDAVSQPSSDDFGEPNNNSFDNNLLVVDETATPVDQSNTYEIKVRAVSSNLVEGDFSDPVSFEDVVKPEVDDVTQGTAGQNEEDVLYVEFSEPMDKPSAETASEYSTDSGSSIDITNISYDLNGINNPADGLTYDLKITVNSASNLSSGSTLTVSSNVTDLNGNGMDSNDNTGNY